MVSKSRAEHDCPTTSVGHDAESRGKGLFLRFVNRFFWGGVQDSWLETE
jgi:hypothetical protein